MSYSIEIISVGGDFYPKIESVINLLNKNQKEFNYSTPPQRLLRKGFMYKFSLYKKDDFFDWLREYKNYAKGSRPYIIAITGGEIEDNYFGESIAEEGIAFFSIHPNNFFNKSQYAYIANFIIRYSLKFVNPRILNHYDTKGCFFDHMGNKPDIVHSLKEPKLCDNCSRSFQPKFNEEIYLSIFGEMSKLLKRIEKYWFYYDLKIWLTPVKTPDNRINFSWLFISLIIGFALSLWGYFSFGSWIISTLIFLIVTTYVLFHNPNRRFFRLGSSLIGMAGIINLPEIMAKIGYLNETTNNKIQNTNIDFNLKLDINEEPIVTVVLILAAVVCFILDSRMK